MASFLFPQYYSSISFLIQLLFIALLISPAYSLIKCTSQNFTGSNAHYSNCTDLPHLNAFLHWTYHPTNSTLSIAFVASPPKPDGWIAWAINPTGTGMAGAQTLLAHKASNGSLVVKTYNISSYSSITESKLSFDVLDKKAESSSDGVIRMFAKLALSENMTTVNHIWQVGPSGKNDFPGKHEFKSENLNAKGTLELVKEAGKISPAPASAPRQSGGGNITRPSGKDTGGCGRIWNDKGFSSFSGFLLLLGILVLGF